MEQHQVTLDRQKRPDTPEIGAQSRSLRQTSITPQAGCATCGSGADGGPPTPTYVYAIGRIETRFPRRSVEKEFAQAAGRSDTAGKTDQETIHSVLSRRENRYLVRQLCWVLSIQGLDTYLVQPSDPVDLDVLVNAIRPAPGPADIDVVVGLLGPIATPEICNGLMVPIVAFDQIYSFDRPTLIKAIPKPDAMPEERFGPAAEELFDRIMLMADNAGATDDHRALNYLAMRYPAIYAKTAEQFAANFALSGLEVRASPLGSVRNLVDVIFSYTHRSTDFTEKYFVRCDVTDEFPFLVSKLAPHYDR